MNRITMAYLILLMMGCGLHASAAPSLVYSTMVEDSTYYHDNLTCYGTQGQFATDVDSEGNLYVGVPISELSHEFPASEREGIRIYRINAEGSDIEIVTTIYGYADCIELIWNKTGLYVHMIVPNPAVVMKIDVQGDIVFAVDSYSNISPIFIDEQGYLYILATVDSTDAHIDFEHIPITPNALDASYNGGDDILIQKYDSDGNLMYSSFLGGPDNDTASKLAVDNEGRLFIAGKASVDISSAIGGETETVIVNPGLIILSPDFSETQAYNQSDLSFSNPKMFIHNDELYSLTLSTIRKRTLIGELVSIMDLNEIVPEFTWPRLVKPVSYSNNKLLMAYIDDQNRIYSVHFKAASAPFTTTIDALYPDSNPGDVDLGIWRITENAELLYGTYFGGSGIEETTMNAVVFRDGKLYVAGYTNSPDYPLTPGAYIDTRTPPLPGQSQPWGLFAFCLDFNEQTDVADESASIPRPLILDPPHPNPFNPQTTITFTLPEAGFALLAVYDISGQLVRELAAETFPAGRHEIVWDGRDTAGAVVSSGVYIARLAAGERTAVRKVTLVR